MSTTDQRLRKRLCRQGERRGLDLSETQIDALMRYLELVSQARSHLNLTGLRDPERILDVLIVESLDFCRPDLIPAVARVLDLGTGAGVPGITLAVWGGDLHLTLLDRTQKKIAFARRAALVLGRHNCHPSWGSAEELARRLSPDERFDVVVARGVGSIAHLMRLAQPLLRPHGKLLLRKPPDTPEHQEAEVLLASPAWAGMRTVPLPESGVKPWVLLAIERSASK
jgi:16S rRNA (guanine527-N7)-methyltransferase